MKLLNIFQQRLFSQTLALSVILMAVAVLTSPFEASARRIDQQSMKELKKELQGDLDTIIKEDDSIDLRKYKPRVQQTFEWIYNEELISRGEMKEAMKSYDELIKKSEGLSDEEKKARVQSLFDSYLNHLNQQTERQCVKEGGLCNGWSCCGDLKCADVPARAKAEQKCTNGGLKCEKDSECCSGVCDGGVCEESRRCYRPQQAGQSCFSNPSCAEGSLCLQYNALTNNIGECNEQGRSCEENVDCCSNKCEGGVCAPNFICKQCVQQGQRAKRGQECCEGLYKNRDGQCVRDFPPLVLPPTSFNENDSNQRQDLSERVTQVFHSLVELVFPTANAAPLLRLDGVLDQRDCMKKIQTMNNYSYCNYRSDGSLLRENCNSSNNVGTGRGGRGNNNNNVGNNNRGGRGSNNSSNCNNNRNNNRNNYGRGGIGSPYCPELELSQKCQELHAQINEASCEGDEYSYACNAGAPGTQDIVKTIEEDESLQKEFRMRAQGNIGASQKLRGNSVEKKEMESPISHELLYLADTLEPSNYKTCDINLKNDYIIDMFMDAGCSNVEGEELTKKCEEVYEELSLSKCGHIENKKERRNCERAAAKAKKVRLSGMDKEQRENKSKQLSLTFAQLAFEYVASGETSDAWEIGGDKTIHERLKQVADKSRESREEHFATLEEKEPTIECYCWAKSTDPNEDFGDGTTEKFEEQCPGIFSQWNSMQRSPEMSEKADASGQKYLRFLVSMSKMKFDLHKSLFVENVGTFKKGHDLAMDIADNDWSNTNTQEYKIYEYTSKKIVNSFQGKQVATAVLVAGVVGVVAGLSTTLLPAWTAAGVITAAVAGGSGGAWLFSSLRGAWDAQPPRIQDEKVRQYKCGKHSQCHVYERRLMQPHSPVCGSHISSTGCVEHFLSVDYGGEDDNYFLVDPFIPVNVDQQDILGNQPKLYEKLDQGFQRGRNHLKTTGPDEKITDKSFFRKPAIDAVDVAHFLPDGYQTPFDDRYALNEDRREKIREGAKEYIIEQGFLTEDMDKTLDRFADYVVQYHYIWPKMSQEKKVSYPVPGFSSYLEFMAHAMGVANNDDKDKMMNYGRAAQKYAQALQGIQQKMSDGVKLGDDTETLDGLGGDEELSDFLSQAEDFNAAFQGEGVGNSGANIGTSASTNTQAGNLSDDASPGDVANAVRKRQEIREEQEKRRKQFEEAVDQDSARAKRVKQAQKEFAQDFYNPLGMENSGASQILGGSTGEKLASRGPVKDEREESKFGDSQESNRQDYNPSMNSQSYDSYSSDSSGYGSSDSSSGSRSNEDVRELQKAAESVERNKERYKNKDSDSIFDMVTKRYFKNYKDLIPKQKKRR